MFNKLLNSFLYGVFIVDMKCNLIGNDKIWFRKEIKISGLFGIENYEDKFKKIFIFLLGVKIFRNKK